MGRPRRQARAGALGATVAAAAVLLVGGCSASSGSESKGDSAARPAAPAAPANPGGPAAAAGAQPSGAPAAAGVTPAADSQMIAYVAQLTLSARDVDRTLARARELTVAAGGYVGGEAVYGSGGSASGQLTLKIPSAAYQQTLDQLAALGEVTARKSQADDLTQQVADVASRVQSQQASVERVRALMAQAKSLSDITSLEAELSRREADLESLQKQQKELSARTSYSTVTLEVRQAASSPTPTPTPAPRAADEGFGGSVGSALSGGWHVLVVVARAVAVALAAVAPFLLVLGVPAFLGYRYWRRRHQAPARASAPEAESPEAPEAPGTETEDGGV